MGSSKSKSISTVRPSVHSIGVVGECSKLQIDSYHHKCQPCVTMMSIEVFILARLADDVLFQVLIYPWILDIHFDHKRINSVIRDSGIPDVNDALIKSSKDPDEDLKALMVNWNLWSLMIRLHGECQSCAFIN